MSLAAATRSETTKLFTTAGWWILGLVLLFYIGSTAAGLGFVFAASATGALPQTPHAPTIPAETLPGIIYSLASSIGYLFPLLIGTLMVTGEFRHKTLTPTFLATPRRGRVLWAKMLVGILAGVLYGVVGLIAAVGPGAGILAGFGLHTGLDTPEVWAQLARTLLALVLWVLVGIGVGTLVRNQVAAIVIVIAFTQLVEPLLRAAAAFVSGMSDVTRFLPGAASDALVGQSIFTLGTTTAASTLTWWVGGIVLLGYALVLLLIGHFASWRRDVS